jgi:hypothetical protein
MPTYEDLQNEFRKLNKASQKFQFQAEGIRPRLLIARTALEALAGANAPPVADIAREALAALNASHVEVETVSLFSVPDTPTPPVELSDLKRYREFVGSLAESNRDIAIRGLDKVVEQISGVNKNAQAFWIRDGLLEMFLRVGHLKPLESHSELNDTFLHVAATIAFNGMDLKPEAFTERLREKGIHLDHGCETVAPTPDDEANRYRSLQQHHHRMQVDAQQTEYEAGILGRKLSIARAALEAMAASGQASEAMKSEARECMTLLDSVSESERMRTFEANVEEGASIPAVDPADIKHVQELYEEAEERHRAAGFTGQWAMGASLIAAVCTPGANVPAVCIRTRLLSIVLQHSDLFGWRRGAELDEGVYRVAATMPINGLQFDPNMFVERLRQQSV